MKVFNKIFLLTTLFLITSSCKVNQILLSDTFKANSNEYNVKGNNGFLINQVIRYGEYKTSKINRGWTKTEKTKIIVDVKEKKKQKVSFTQYTPSGKEAEVIATNIYNNNLLDLVKGISKYLDSYEDSYTGTIKLSNDDIWMFVVENSADDNDYKGTADGGIAMDNNGNSIEIRGIKKREKQNFFSTPDTRGFELVRKGKILGAVSLVKNGTVWLNKELTERDKIIVSSLATALLFKKEFK